MSNPLESRPTGLDVLAASLEDAAHDEARREEDAVIIAALPLRPRPGLYLDHDDTSGRLLILEFPEDPEDGSAIIGLAIPDGKGGHYLGCTGCGEKIAEEAAGMCQWCRQDIAWRDEQDRAAYEATQ